jgi:hypothetical protein
MINITTFASTISVSLIDLDYVLALGFEPGQKNWNAAHRWEVKCLKPVYANWGTAVRRNMRDNKAFVPAFVDAVLDALTTPQPTNTVKRAPKRTPKAPKSSALSCELAAPIADYKYSVQDEWGSFTNCRNVSAKLGPAATADDDSMRATMTDLFPWLVKADLRYAPSKTSNTVRRLLTEACKLPKPNQAALTYQLGPDMLNGYMIDRTASRNKFSDAACAPIITAIGLTIKEQLIPHGAPFMYAGDFIAGLEGVVSPAAIARMAATLDYASRIAANTPEIASWYCSQFDLVIDEDAAVNYLYTH